MSNVIHTISELRTFENGKEIEFAEKTKSDEVLLRY